MESHLDRDVSKETGRCPETLIWRRWRRLSQVGSYTVGLSIEAWHEASVKHVQVLDQSMQIRCYLVWIILLVAEDTGFHLVRSFGGSSQACLWHMVGHVDVPQQVLDIVTCCAILYHPFGRLIATERWIFCKLCGMLIHVYVNRFCWPVRKSLNMAKIKLCFLMMFPWHAPKISQ